ncbi:MAG: CCA tRNA nucleotidyltransferase [Gemmatimonas sp.]
MTARDTRAVIAALQADGAEARFVGGCVRDTLTAELLGHGAPVRDIDIATPEPPQQVAELLARAGIRAVPTGIEHGTVTAVVDGKPFEITTLRRDVETFGRRARVAFTDDWKEDAARRDFTMNAMFLASDGRVYDAFGGLADIKAGRVRFVGDPRERIEEDVLRLLRYFRFHAHFDRAGPDAAALAACRAMAPKLHSLSGERVHAELFKLLEARDPAATLTLMEREGVLAHVLPEAGSFARLRALAAIEADMLAVAPDALLRLAAALEGGGPPTIDVAHRLRLSNRERARLAQLATSAPIAPGMSERTVRRMLQRMGKERFRDHVLLNWADARKVEARAGDAAVASHVDDAAWRALIDVAERWRPAVFPVTGEDALRLGIPQGPDLGETLRAVEEWWADEDFRPDREACLAQLQALAQARAR